MVTVTLVIAVVLGASGQDAGDDSKALTLQIEKHIEKREWKEARAAAKKLKRMLSADRRKDAVALLTRIDGREAFCKIQDSWKKSKHPKKAESQLARFLKKYAKSSELRKLVAPLQKEVREALYHVIEDFEEEVDPEYWIAVRGSEKVRQGEVGARWRSQRLDESTAYLYCDVKDWTQYTHLVLWIYNADAKKGGTITLDPYGEGPDEDYFQYLLTVNWKGWKELRLPLQGKKSRFQRHGKADWKTVDTLRFYKEDGRKIDIVVDDVRLERAMGKRK